MSTVLGQRRHTRRQVLAATASGLAALTITTPLGSMTPRQAQAAQTPLTTLSESEAVTYEAFAEVLCPGAREAGVSRFLDAQLGSQHPLLVLRYLDYNGDPTAFYQGGIAALDALAQARHGSSFSDLAADQQAAIAGDLLGGNVENWDGPPPFLVYFAMRSDAVDVTYGTPEGFEALNIPYLPHIDPPEGWS